MKKEVSLCHILQLELWTESCGIQAGDDMDTRQDRGVMAQVGNLLMGWEDGPVGKMLVLQV